MERRLLLRGRRRLAALAGLVLAFFLLATVPSLAGRPGVLAPGGVSVGAMEAGAAPPWAAAPRGSPRCSTAWGLLPVAANEYWQGSQGDCPYALCGEPYSFVRDPLQEPPFRLVSSNPEVWAKNACPDPYNNNVCQGPYEGYGENFGKAFALMGGDAKPNYGSPEPRGAVMLDCRYDALTSGGTWNMLQANDQWEHNTSCPAMGFCRDAMAQVIYDGGYYKTPLPDSAYEPPIAYIGDWPYCWASPPNEDNCFNYPAMDRSEPYDSLMFLNGTSAAYLAQVMYDGGNYLEGRYAPGEDIIVMAYNSYPAYWGEYTAVIVGYFRAVIVGYGSSMGSPCDGTPGDWQSFVPCISGLPNTLYGLAKSPLVLDPTLVFNYPPNQAPGAPAGPSPADEAIRVPLTATLSWAPSADPDGDAVTYDVAFGTVSPPPLVLTDVVTPTFDPGPLLSHTTYSWAITASDCVSSTAGPVWRFTTGPNRAPEEPHSPVPFDGAGGVALTATLAWACSDPDGDALTYTVVLGTGGPPLLVTTTVPFYDPGGLLSDTAYSWVVAASDGLLTTPGPQWSFRTGRPGWTVYLPLTCKRDCVLP